MTKKKVIIATCSLFTIALALIAITPNKSASAMKHQSQGFPTQTKIENTTAVMADNQYFQDASDFSNWDQKKFDISQFQFDMSQFNFEEQLTEFDKVPKTSSQGQLLYIDLELKYQDILEKTERMLSKAQSLGMDTSEIEPLYDELKNVIEQLIPYGKEIQSELQLADQAYKDGDLETAQMHTENAKSIYEQPVVQDLIQQAKDLVDEITVKIKELIASHKHQSTLEQNPSRKYSNSFLMK